MQTITVYLLLSTLSYYAILEIDDLCYNGHLPCSLYCTHLCLGIVFKLLHSILMSLQTSKLHAHGRLYTL
jgi:hypothetical protein